MKITITIAFTKLENKEPVTILVSKSSGDTLPSIRFDGRELVETIPNIEIGDFSQDDVLLFSLLNNPSSNSVIALKDIKTKSFYVFHSSTVTVSIAFETTSKLTILNEKFTKAVSFLEEFTIPWYLKTSVLYTSAKAHLTKFGSHEKVSMTIDQISVYTLKLLQAVYPLLTKEEISSLVTRIDELLSTYFVAYDAGVDSIKSKLAVALHGFKTALVAHSEKFLETLEEYKQAGIAAGAKAASVIRTNVDVAATYVATNYPAISTSAVQAVKLAIYCKSEISLKAEEMLTVVREWLAWSVKQVDETRGALRESVIRTRESVQSTVQARVSASVQLTGAATQSLLQTAKPYVHHAVTASQPLLAQAVQVYQAGPVGPYLQPLVVRAVSMKEALEHHPVSGPYVDVVLKEGIKAYETVRAYCLESNPVSVPIVEVTKAARKGIPLPGLATN